MGIDEGRLTEALQETSTHQTCRAQAAGQDTLHTYLEMQWTTGLLTGL